MLYREIKAVCSEIHTIHINTVCGQNVEFVNVKPGGTFSDQWVSFRELLYPVKQNYPYLLSKFLVSRIWQTRDNKEISSLNSCVCPYHITVRILWIFLQEI